jgi:AcrR family transcriptional regulator
MKASSTKEKIMNAAIRLFSEKGYDLVSMRDIAQEVGIKASSIYNHFPSKRDILKSMYEFHARENRSFAPDPETLLTLAETEPPHEVLMKLDYNFPSEIHEKLDRIFIIASQEIYLDKDSEIFIREYFFKMYSEVWVRLLERMIELGKIEPVDVDSFVRLLINFAYSAASLNGTSMKMTEEQWRKSLLTALSLLKPVKEDDSEETAL